MKDDRLISLNAAIDALDKVAEMFPYRIPGNAKTYRQYNEAWSDAIDAAENALEALPSAQPTGTKTVQVDDCISRAAAIDAINRLDIPEDMCVFEILSHIELEIGNLPSAQQWIPTSERTPEKSGNYLVTTPNGQVELRYYSTLYRWHGWVDMVAWMPLPTPYREGGQE